MALDEFFLASKNLSSLSSNGKYRQKTKGVDAADVEEFFGFDPNECFLLLDDVLVPED